MPAFTGAEADAAACPSHGRHFRSYRRTPTPSPRGVAVLNDTPPSAFPLEGFAALNDTSVACQTREPTDPQGDRCPHIPAALAATYPLRCFAPQWARFDNRPLVQRTRPYPRCCQRQRRKRYKRSPEPTTSPAEPIPRDQHRQIRTCPPRAKGPLDRRSKRLSFPHFFLRRKKCGRRRPSPRQGKIDSPPQRRNPPRAKGSLNRRFERLSLVAFFQR